MDLFIHLEQLKKFSRLAVANLTRVVPSASWEAKVAAFASITSVEFGKLAGESTRHWRGQPEPSSKNANPRYSVGIKKLPC